MVFRFLILIVTLLAPASAMAQGTHDEVQTARVPRKEPKENKTYKTVILADEKEVGDWYVMKVRENRTAILEIANNYVSSSGATKTESACKPGTTIAISVVPGGGPPAGTPVPTGTISGGLGERKIQAPDPGPWLLSVRMDAGVCLRAIRFPIPISPGSEWWVTRAGKVTDMAVGGGSPQCPPSGLCPWYTRVTR